MIHRDRSGTPLVLFYSLITFSKFNRVLHPGQQQQHIHQIHKDEQEKFVNKFAHKYQTIQVCECKC